jgi:hypothetical protein
MRQRLTLIAVKQNDVAGLGLRFAQLQAQPHALDLVLAAFQRVPASSPAEAFSYGLGQFRPADLEVLSRLDLSPEARHRPVGPVGNGGVEQRRDDRAPLPRSLPVAGQARRSPSKPRHRPRLKSLRQRRPVSSRTPKASAIRGLVHPDSVSNSVRARSVSPRSRDWVTSAAPRALPDLPSPEICPPCPTLNHGEHVGHIYGIWNLLRGKN